MGKYKCLAGSEEDCAEQMTAPHIILTFYCRENTSIDDKGAFFETVAALSSSDTLLGVREAVHGRRHGSSNLVDK